MFLRAETAADPRRCFSSVYTKSDGVLNTRVLSRACCDPTQTRSTFSSSLAGVGQVLIFVLFADGGRLHTQLSPLC